MLISLITGLDGSGKSTILSKLEKLNTEQKFKIIYLPHIDISNLSRDKILYKTAIFINKLSHDADLQKLPQLKAIALFSSMLLYQKLIYFDKGDKAKHIFCERHPLIDVGVYAQFYAQKLAPDSISASILNKLDNLYPEELDYILSLVPKDLIFEQKKKMYSLMHFIYQWFFVENKYQIKQLEYLFKTSIPNRIYYLKTEPEILFNRIKNREVKEAHESMQVFKKLDKYYDELFRTIQKDNTVSINIIDANNIKNLETLPAKLITKD